MILLTHPAPLPAPAKSCGLTLHDTAANLSPLSGRIQAGILSPPLNRPEQSRYLCGIFLLAILARVKTCGFNYGGLHGAAFGWAAPVCGGDNPVQSASRNLSPSFGGLSISNRIHRMTTQTVRANTAQNPNKTAVFSVYLHRQLIASGIAGVLEIRIKRRNPATVVKFQGWGV